MRNTETDVEWESILREHELLMSLDNLSVMFEMSDTSGTLGEHIKKEYEHIASLNKLSVMFVMRETEIGVCNERN